MSGRKRADMPALTEVHGASLSVVDVVTDDAPAVPPVPAGRLDVEHAKALTERIRLTAQTTRERLQRLAELVEQARAGEVADVLGYASWTAYLADALGGQMRLDGADRRELVGYLTQQGMSTRAIAPIVGASPKTVAREAAATRVSGDTPAPVTGRDGKTYAPAGRFVCPVCYNLVREPRRAAHEAQHAREDAARVAGRALAAEQPVLDGMPEPVALPEPEPLEPWQVKVAFIEPSPPKAAYRCLECGAILIVPPDRFLPASTPCPVCTATAWGVVAFGVSVAA